MYEKRPLIIRIALILILLTALLFAVQKNDLVPKHYVKKTANHFLEALQYNDPKTLRWTVAYGVIVDDKARLFYHAPVEDFRDAVAAQFQVSDAMPEEWKDAIKDILDEVDDKLIEGYEILDMEKVDDGWEVTAHVTFGLDVQAMDEVDIEETIRVLSEKYQREHETELYKIKRDKGETAMRSALLAGISKDVAYAYKLALFAGGWSEKDMTLTIKKTENGWRVAGYTIE